MAGLAWRARTNPRTCRHSRSLAFFCIRHDRPKGDHQTSAPPPSLVFVDAVAVATVAVVDSILLKRLHSSLHRVLYPSSLHPCSSSLTRGKHLLWREVRILVVLPPACRRTSARILLPKRRTPWWRKRRRCSPCIISRSRSRSRRVV